MKILFNADDFGLTKGVTDGIMKAHLDGIVGATTLMMNGYATTYAIQKAKERRTLKVGIHLVLTWGQSLRNDVPDLVTPDGTFKYNNTYRMMEPPNLAQVEKEWSAQIEAFLATGLPLHHIDSHHHVHGWEPLQSVIIKLAKHYRVPVRYVDHLKSYPDLLLTDTLYLDFYDDGVSDQIFEDLKQLDVQSVEVMTHPAYIDHDLREVSSYLDKREEELAILCRLEKPEWMEVF